MTRKISWELYRSFLAVLRAGSLSGAARELGVAQPTLGRHVAALEAALGQALFTRAQTGFLATDAARALQPYAEAMESTAAALLRVAESKGEAGVHGTVRITASKVICVEVLPPMLARLQADHPALKLELVASDQVQDLLHREADIAVRMVRPEQNQLIARRIGTIPLGLHASRDYLARAGMPASLAALGTHTLIGPDKETAYLRSVMAAMPGLARENFALRCDDHLGQLALIRAGAGIGMCQAPIAARDPNLVRLFPAQVSLPLETWLSMHEDLRHTPRYRVCFDALVAALSAYAADPSVPSVPA
jgi:DNA-binding transcriptional LysR family regulator